MAEKISRRMLILGTLGIAAGGAVTYEIGKSLLAKPVDAQPTQPAKDAVSNNAAAKDPEITTLREQVDRLTEQQSKLLEELRKSREVGGTASGALPSRQETPVPTRAVPTQAPTVVSNRSESLLFPEKFNRISIPTDHDAMPKVTLEEGWNKHRGQFFHRVFKPEVFKAPNWDGADIFGWALAFARENQFVIPKEFGNSGEFHMEVNPAGSRDIRIALGIMTSDLYQGNRVIDDLRQGTGENGIMRTFQKDKAVAMWFRTYPTAEYDVFDLTTGEYIAKGGQRLTTRVSEGGDGAIIMPDCGAIGVVIGFTDPETADMTPFQTKLWWGPHDKPQSPNSIDARSLSLPACPGGQANPRPAPTPGQQK